MKRICLYIILLGAINFCNQANAQDQEIEQLILDVQKLSQFKQILSDMKTAYTVIMQGYTTVRDLSQGDFDLHKAFLDGLMAISPAVRNYKKAADIVSMQLEMLKEYHSAFNRFKSSDLFNPDELVYIGKVYNSLLDVTLKNISDLTTVITANQLRMSDAERLAAIDRLYDDTLDKLTFLRSFNNNTSMLALQRQKEMNEAKALQEDYGEPPVP
ncbi:MAG: TerB family tellurite resistance protein [Chitinophagaceae bacterium]|nr:MAG: TerB family tellurite resistance protein [Chitinophagaceae bacterium]